MEIYIHQFLALNPFEFFLISDPHVPSEGIFGCKKKK